MLGLKKLNTSHDPAVALLGVALTCKMRTYVHTKTCTQLFQQLYSQWPKSANNPNVHQQANGCTNGVYPNSGTCLAQRERATDTRHGWLSRHPAEWRGQTALKEDVCVPNMRSRKHQAISRRQIGGCRVRPEKSCVTKGPRELWELSGTTYHEAQQFHS